MKKYWRKRFFILLFASGMLFVLPVLSQNPPSMPGNHGQNGGAGAPIGGGLGILLALGAAYGGRKVYKALKERDDAGR